MPLELPRFHITTLELWRILVRKALSRLISYKSSWLPFWNCEELISRFRRDPSPPPPRFSERGELFALKQFCCPPPPFPWGEGPLSFFLLSLSLSLPLSLSLSLSLSLFFFFFSLSLSLFFFFLSLSLYLSLSSFFYLSLSFFLDHPFKKLLTQRNPEDLFSRWLRQSRVINYAKNSLRITLNLELHKMRVTEHGRAWGLCNRQLRKIMIGELISWWLRNFAENYTKTLANSFCNILAGGLCLRSCSGSLFGPVVRDSRRKTRLP